MFDQGRSHRLQGIAGTVRPSFEAMLATAKASGASCKAPSAGDNAPAASYNAASRIDAATRINAAAASDKAATARIGRSAEGSSAPAHCDVTAYSASL